MIVFDNPPLRLRKCRDGLMLFHMNDAYVGRSLDIYGEYSELEAQLFRRVLRPGMVAVDAGANIGVFALVFAKAVFPGGHVVAVEPQRILHQMMCANLALNGVRNAHTFQVALGNAAGTVIAPHLDFASAANFGGVALTPTGPGARVDVVPLDDLGLETCHFIKIDVEGMEAEVIEGADRTIAAHRPLLYVENAFGDKSEALIEQIKSLNYRLYRHVPPLFNPSNFFGAARDIFGSVASYNMLCIPRESANQPSYFNEILSAEDWPLHLIGSRSS